jgi:hypothetical protein
MDKIVSIFRAYLSYSKLLEENGFRRPNFPEGLSETLAGSVLSKYYSKQISKAPTGDLICKETKRKYEIKCFSSTGPTSFGPEEAWDSLVFVDFTKYKKGDFIVYEFPFKNTDKEIQELVMSKRKKETFQQQCASGRRPRICFDDFCKQQDQSKRITIFNGNINDLI